MKYRSRTDIVQQILDSLDNSETGHLTKSMIMYGAYLNHPQTTEYIDLMEKAKLISVSDDNIVAITEKGQSFLNTLIDVARILGLKSVGKKGIGFKSGKRKRSK